MTVIQQDHMSSKHRSYKDNFKSTLLLLICTLFPALNLHSQNHNIEPQYEYYSAANTSIEIDGDISDWANVQFIEPRFEVSDGRATGKGNVTIKNVTYSTFAEYGIGTWTGPDDHKTAVGVAWDQEGVYLGIVVTDDEHEHASSSPWNGDGVQLGLTNNKRDTITHVFSFCIRDGYESGKVYKNGDEGILTALERGAGHHSFAMVRNDNTQKTTYELKVTPDSLGINEFEVGYQLGIGFIVNDGDFDTPGQQGWSGWGTQVMVWGRDAPAAALVTLVPKKTHILTVASVVAFLVWTSWNVFTA